MKALLVTLILMIGGISSIAYSQSADSTKTKPVLYVVGTSHLDTQWRWDIRTTINEYIPATFADNYKLFEQFPGYTFSFEGSFRYQLLKEYRPDLYARLKPYVDAGRWRVTGSWVDAVDVNIPSFESLVRHTLYGNGFYKREFGVKSRDVFLPDCFGFGYALPSIASHCGLKSFSTQKLAWGSWIGIPFDIGIWEGVDGSALVAAVNPSEYVSRIETDLTRDTLWLNTAERLRKSSDMAAAFRYFGTGDIGGAPDSTSVSWLQKSLTSDGPLEVRSIGADDIVDLVTDADRSRLPRYKGEMVMTRHGVGCYTSQAAMKRWNRKNELLADATERASVTASLLGGIEYPTVALRETWERFLWHQFHDDATGTSIPEAYVFSWNDEVLCQNRFAGMLTHAASAVTTQLDTRAKGIAVTVYNPVSIDRKEVVEVALQGTAGSTGAVRVFGPDGTEVPSQVIAPQSDSVRAVFLADVPSVGWAVYDVRMSATAFQSTGTVSATLASLENSCYTVKLDANGDVASIHDKRHDRELLAAPIRLAKLFDKPNAWPSWELDYDEVEADPQSYVSGPAVVEVVESGPVRAAVLITRQAGKSTFKTRLSLSEGDWADRLTFDCEIDWYERETLLKATFPFTASNEHVTYDIGLGTIQRGRNHPKLYEVPGQQWADLTSSHGDYGVTVLNDSRYGWDHPDSNTVRLSLIHTPGVFDSWSWVKDQRSQDNGRHQVSFAIVGHRGDWREGRAVMQGVAFNQPLIAFQTSQHVGTLGKRHSLARVQPERGSVLVNAIKRAEESEEIIIRLRETSGMAAHDVTVHFAAPIVSAREVDGSEDPLGSATIADGKLLTSLGPYQPRAFAVRLQPMASTTPSLAPTSTPIDLPYNLDGISLDENRLDGDFEGGRTIAGELLPDTIIDRNVKFVPGSRADRALNVVSCNGQTVALPSTHFNSISLLLNAVGGPAEGVFSIDGHDTSIWIQDYAEPIAQWNNRLVGGSFVEEPDQISPGYINRQDIGWFGTHRHNAHNENEAYQFTYLFRVDLPVSAGVKSLTLPQNPRIRVFCATAVNDPHDSALPAHPLYDELSATLPRVIAHRKSFVDSLLVELSSPTPGAVLRYTVDGTDPNESSPMYAGPIIITETTNLKARAQHATIDDAYVAVSTFSRLEMTDPIAPPKSVSGLACRYYEGSWDKLPGFDTLKVKKSAVLDSVAVPPFARDEDYGVVLTGFITVPSDGLYDFFIGSDDGSDFRIADTLLIDNDGLHGMGDVEGAIGLRAGTHPIQIRMFQKKGDEGLRLMVDGPGIRKQSVPPSWLSHRK